MKKIIGLLSFLSCAQLLIAQQKIDSNYANSYYLQRMEYFNQVPKQQHNIVFLGNSITERGKWQDLLPGKKVINRGIGGDNTFGLLARLDVVLAEKPTTIFLLIGINDLGRGLPIPVIVNNYQRIIARIKKQSPKTKLYIQSVLPLNEDALPYAYLKGKNVKVKELNVAIQEVAKEHHLTYINLHEVFADDKGELRKELTEDGIHLKPMAYIEWVNYLKAKKFI
jgi:lysophospholipase L1-like esterase